MKLITLQMQPIKTLHQWLLSLLLGSAFYAIYQGTVHFSDWCYLGVSTVVAAGVSGILVPLNRLLLRQLAAHGSQWPALGRWGWLLGGTLALFGLANVLVWPLLSWLGPGMAWPWGVAAVLVAVTMHRSLLTPDRQCKNKSSQSETDSTELRISTRQFQP
jgi:hypothetical protein